MSTTFTPPPWEVANGTNPQLGKVLAVVAQGACHGETGEAICIVAQRSKITERDRAIARLIAAAPELLTACKLILAIDADPKSGVAIDLKAREQIQDAITKATTP